MFLALELGWELQLVSRDVFSFSPFAHVHWTIADVPVASMVWLTGLAAVLIVTGLAGFRRRDVG